MFYAFRTLANPMTALVLGSSVFFSAAQIPPPSSQGDTAVPAETAVATAYQAYLRAWKDKDYATLNQILSDNYKAVNFRGVVSTKANEIASAREDRDYAAMDGNIMSVTVFGDSAVASGLIDSSWKDKQGTIQQLTVRFLAMLQKQKGEWKLVATQSTKFNRPAEH